MSTFCKDSVSVSFRCHVCAFKSKSFHVKSKSDKKTTNKKQQQNKLQSKDKVYFPSRQIYKMSLKKYVFVLREKLADHSSVYTAVFLWASNKSNAFH